MSEDKHYGKSVLEDMWLPIICYYNAMMYMKEQERRLS